jgi:hypothetical protein
MAGINKGAFTGIEDLLVRDYDLPVVGLINKLNFVGLYD